MALGSSPDRPAAPVSTSWTIKLFSLSSYLISIWIVLRNKLDTDVLRGDETWRAYSTLWHQKTRTGSVRCRLVFSDELWKKNNSEKLELTIFCRRCWLCWLLYCRPIMSQVVLAATCHLSTSPVTLTGSCRTNYSCSALTLCSLFIHVRL